MTSTDKLYTHTDTEILIYNLYGDIVNRLQYKVQYQYKNYFTDTKKNLYKITDNKPVLVSTLKKNIFKMIENIKLYLIDVYGDVYEVEDSNLRFITGVLCTIKDVQVKEDNIFILDKYNRIRICGMDGRIQDFKFDMKIQGFVVDRLGMKYIYEDESNEGVKVEGKILKILSNLNKTVVLTHKNIYLYMDGKMTELGSGGDILIGENNEIYRIEDNQIKLI